MAPRQGARANANLLPPSRRVSRGAAVASYDWFARHHYGQEMAICCMPRHCMQGGAAGEEPPAPKKRGRPRKNPDVVVSEADLKSKARRARPRASKVSPRLIRGQSGAPSLGSSSLCHLHAELASLLKKDCAMGSSVAPQRAPDATTETGFHLPAVCCLACLCCCVWHITKQRVVGACRQRMKQILPRSGLWAAPER